MHNQNIVYHYTSPDGILGILRNKTLHFTDGQYFNDKGEFLYILEPFKEAYAKFAENHCEGLNNMDKFFDTLLQSPYESKGLKIYVNENLQKTKGLSSLRYYVLCTSTNSDSSSMWNYYVKNGAYQGYNLGIDRTVIKNNFLSYVHGQIQFMDGAVIYDKKKQIETILDKFEELYIRWDNCKDEAMFLNFQAELYSYFERQKLFFKNPAFSSEQEYRFILKVDNVFTENDKLSVHYRAGKSGIITPYIEWKYTLDDNEKLFKQITLSPMIESNLAEESFKRLLAATVRQNIEIKQSLVQLRF